MRGGAMLAALKGRRLQGNPRDSVAIAQKAVLLVRACIVEPVWRGFAKMSAGRSARIWNLSGGTGWRPAASGDAKTKSPLGDFPAGSKWQGRQSAFGAGFFDGFFLLGFSFLFLGLELIVHQFEDGDFGAVAAAGCPRNDAGVAAGAVREFRRDLAEQFLRNARRHDVRSGLPPRLQGVFFAEGDHLFRHWTCRFGARQRGGNSSVFQQVGHEVPQRRAAMPRIASQLRSRLEVSHRLPIPSSRAARESRRENSDSLGGRGFSPRRKPSTMKYRLPLQPDVLFRRRRRGLARQRRPDNAAVLVELHAQREAHLHQYIFDLVQGLAAEVLGLEHFVFALLHQFANGLDIRVLQAVVRAHGKLEFLDGAVQMLEARIVHDVRRRLDGVHRLFKVDEDAHVVLDELRSETDGVLRSQRAVGPHFDHQLFVVGHLAETRGFDRVVDLAHRRVHAVHRNVPDGQVFVVVAVRCHVPAAVLHAHFDLQLAAFADRGDVHALVQDGEVRIFFDLRGSNRARLLDVHVNGLRQVRVELDGHLLQVEDNVGGILAHARNRRKFVQHSFDFYRGDRRSFDRTKQRAAQRVADRGSPAALKRLCGKAAVLFGQRFQLGRETLWLLKSLPHRVPSFWASTLEARKTAALDTPAKISRGGFTPPSSLAPSRLLRVQLDDQLLVERRILHVIPLGQGHDLGLEILAVHLQPRHPALALRHVARIENHGVLVHVVLDGDFVGHFHEIRRDIDLLPVHADVSVQNELPGLRVRRREAGGPQRVIKATLQHDDQVFARRPLGAHGFLEIPAKLRFQQPVGALYLLLLAQLQAVAGYFRAPGLPVLPRNEVALLNRALLGKAPQTF